MIRYGTFTFCPFYIIHLFNQVKVSVRLKCNFQERPGQEGSIKT